MVFDRTDRLSEALAAFQKAAQIQPTNVRNHRELGTFYMHHANYKDAIGEFERVVALVPERSDAHFILASALRQQGQFTDAESELRVAIGLQDTSVAEHALGYTLMLLERDQEAISCYLRARTLGPETALLWLNLGISLSRVGRDGEARAAFQQGMRIAQKDMADPRNGRERAQVAYLAARLGDGQRAESEMAQALQLWPNDSDTRWMAALTYEALGRRADTLGLLASSPFGLLMQLSRYPDVASLRHDTRFIELLVSKHIQ
jgi:tetratricopeptide (TPR) repeat protein